MRNRAVVIAVLSVAAILSAAYLAYPGRLASVKGLFRGGAAAPAGEALTEPPTVSVGRGDVQQTVVAPGQLVATEEMVLTSGLAGRLAEIDVRPGDVVAQGDVLAQLDPGPFEEALQTALVQLAQAEAEHAHQLAQAELALQVARATLAAAERGNASDLAQAEIAAEKARLLLEQAQGGDASSAVAIATVRLNQATSALAGAQEAYDRAWDPARDWEMYMNDPTSPYPGAPPTGLSLSTRLEADRAGTERALEAAQAAVEIARAEYRAASAAGALLPFEIQLLEQDLALAELQVETLREGVDSSLAAEVERAQLELDGLAAGVDIMRETAVRQARADLAATTLTAPCDGVVLEIYVRPGESVVAGSQLIALMNPAAMEVRVTVIEEDLPLVQAGQPADLFFDAVPAAALQGRVARVVPRRVAGESRPLYYVYIAPGGQVDGLVPGMTADAAIIIDQRTGALRLPRALVQADASGKALVEVWAGGRAEGRQIQIGLRGDVYVEILGGLDENEQVVGQ